MASNSGSSRPAYAAPTVGVLGGNGFSLGDGEAYAIIAFDPRYFIAVYGSPIFGSVGVGGPNLGIQLAGDTISGNLVTTGVAPGAPAINGTVTGSISGNSATLSSDIAALGALSASLLRETGTAFPSTRTVNASAGVLDKYGNEVFTTSALPFGGTITVNGDGSHAVVVNVTGSGTQLISSNVKLTGGITADQVLFNFAGGPYQLLLGTYGTVFNGTILAPNSSIAITGMTVNGHVFGGAAGSAFLWDAGATAHVPPSIFGTVSGQADAGAGPLAPFAGVLVIDPEAASQDSATILLTNAGGVATDANGVLSGAGLTKAGTGLYTLAATTPAALTAELAALVFTPAAQDACSAASVATGFKLSVTDAFATTQDTATSVTATTPAPSPTNFTQVLPTQALSLSGTGLAPLEDPTGLTRDPDQTVAINLLAGISCPNTAANIVTGPANGLLVANPDGTFSYTPNFRFAGTDSFTYDLSRAGAVSKVATVTLQVAPANLTVTANQSGLTLLGGPGTDTMTVTGSNETLTAGSGTATISVTGDGAKLYSGTGNDTFNVTGQGATIDNAAGTTNRIFASGSGTVITGSAGADTINVAGDGGVIFGGGGQDLFTITGNNNQIYGNFIESAPGALITSAAAPGPDNISISGSGNAVSTGEGNNSVAINNTTLSAANTVVTGDGNNHVSLAGGDNICTFGAGTNVATVGGSNNTVTTGAGLTEIDVAYGGGNVLVDGGGQAKTFVFAYNPAQNEIDHFNVAADRVIMTGTGGATATQTPVAGGINFTVGSDTIFFAGLTTPVTNFTVY